ncbi:MAG: hypothetical protein HC769_31240 [Cyanobacteria bacterium CRU_2_1]|nr:hypothetical protein [Cyanobacteria bacterium CRU_2_1]
MFQALAPSPTPKPFQGLKQIIRRSPDRDRQPSPTPKPFQGSAILILGKSCSNCRKISICKVI